VSPVVVIAEPKSVILMSVPPTIRMFAGLMSRCVTPSLCAKSSARVHLKMISTILSSGSRFSGTQNAHDRVVDLGDVRVGELAGERGLGDEQLAEDLPALRVVEPLLVDDLHRDVAARELVVAQVDLARRAVAELADDLVLADPVHGEGVVITPAVTEFKDVTRG
jgi:hypothetical protein